MFSATADAKTKRVADSVLRSEFSYFSVDPQDQLAAGVAVNHYFMSVPAKDKLDTLFSFVKSHQKSKCIVFFSSCKQVRFAYEALSKLKPGVHLMEPKRRQMKKLSCTAGRSKTSGPPSTSTHCWLLKSKH